MAPKGKKGKKGKPALGDWGSDGDDDPPGLDAMAAAAQGGAAADEAASSDAAAPARQTAGKGKVKKGKKGKGKKASGDWSDDDEAPQPAAAAPTPASASEDEEPEPTTRGGSGSVFAALPDHADDSTSEPNGAEHGGSDSDSIEPVRIMQCHSPAHGVLLSACCQAQARNGWHQRCRQHRVCMQAAHARHQANTPHLHICSGHLLDMSAHCLTPPRVQCYHLIRCVADRAHRGKGHQGVPAPEV